MFAWGNTGVRIAGIVVAYFLVSSPFAGHALAGKAEESRAYLDKAMTAFGLGRYPIAAENFEKAFELNQDPSAVFNAAPS